MDLQRVPAAPRALPDIHQTKNSDPYQGPVPFWRRAENAERPSRNTTDAANPAMPSHRHSSLVRRIVHETDAVSAAIAKTPVPDC
jgi:hypothetical protein